MTERTSRAHPITDRRTEAASHRAVVRLRGLKEISPETFLVMVEGVREALRPIGVIDVHIEVEPEDIDAG